jgi:ankyrin repeat protein
MIEDALVSIFLTRKIDKFGRTTLHWAALHASVAVVQEILKAYPEHINKGDNDGWTPIFVACLNSM